MDLKRYFEDVERRIDPGQETRIAAEWEAFCDLRCPDEYFSPRRTPAPSSIAWPKVLINDAFDDMELMLYSQLKTVSDMLAGGGGLLLAVRPNYGTAIIPSMYGAGIFRLPDEADTLPGASHCADGVEALPRITGEHALDYTRGLAPRVFEFGERWQALAQNYPLIRRYVYLYNPDLQGPFLLVDALAGSDIYYALYDDPEMVAEALSFMTDVYIDFTRRWQTLHPAYGNGYSVEWGLLHRGGTILRNDAIVNLSENMYREFAMPYDARVFGELGGGMHFCGRGDHYIAAACEIEGLSCVNLSQPELNDMETIYRHTIDRDKIIIGMPDVEIERLAKNPRPLRGRVHSGAALAAYRREQTDTDA